MHWWNLDVWIKQKDAENITGRARGTKCEDTVRLRDADVERGHTDSRNILTCVTSMDDD